MELVDWLISRSLGWSVGRSVDQSVARTVDSLVSWLVGRSVSRSIDWFIGRLVDRLVAGSVDSLVGWLLGRSLARLIHWSVGWSLARLIHWWIGWSVGRLLGCFIGRLIDRSLVRLIHSSVGRSLGWFIGRFAGRLIRWSDGRLSNPELSFRFDNLIAVRQADCLVGRHCHSEGQRKMFCLNTSNTVPNYTASIRVPQYSFPCSQEPCPEPVEEFWYARLVFLRSLLVISSYVFLTLRRGLCPLLVSNPRFLRAFLTFLLCYTRPLRLTILVRPFQLLNNENLSLHIFAKLRCEAIWLPRQWFLCVNRFLM